MKKIAIALLLSLVIILVGTGFRTTTVYDHCAPLTTMVIKDTPNVYILDKSIRYVSEETTMENPNVNGKFEMCIGDDCTTGYSGHFNPIKVQSNKVRLTGKMRESEAHMMLSFFVDPRWDIEALVDNKRVWISPLYFESGLLVTDTNNSISFFQKQFQFQCPLPKQEILDWRLSW